jgi:hypothetical protein
MRICKIEFIGIECAQSPDAILSLLGSGFAVAHVHSLTDIIRIIIFIVKSASKGREGKIRVVEAIIWGNEP